MLVYFSHNKALWKKTHNVTDERNNPLLMPRVAFYSAKHERKTTKRSSSLFSSSSSFGKENQQHWLCSFGILKSDIPFLVCRVFYLSLQILQISTLTNARIGAKSWCRGAQNLHWKRQLEFLLFGWDQSMSVLNFTAQNLLKWLTTYHQNYMLKNVKDKKKKKKCKQFISQKSNGQWRKVPTSTWMKSD